MSHERGTKSSCISCLPLINNLLLLLEDLTESDLPWAYQRCCSCTVLRLSILFQSWIDISVIWGNFQPFRVALLSIIPCIVSYLDILIMSSIEDEFVEQLREFSHIFGKSYAWVKAKNNQGHLLGIFHWCTSLSSTRVNVIPTFLEKSKLQFENTRCTLRTLKSEIWNT